MSDHITDPDMHGLDPRDVSEDFNQAIQVLLSVYTHSGGKLSSFKVVGSSKKDRAMHKFTITITEEDMTLAEEILIEQTLRKFEERESE